jgi:hypothetical protein
MKEGIERLLGTSKKDILRAYIGPRARNRIWKYAWMTQPSDETRNSYVKENYWEGRVKPALQILLEKLYGNRNDLLPDLPKEQIYSVASVVRKPFEETRRDIEPIPEDKLIVSPAIALIYGIKENGEMVDFYLLNEKNMEIPYGRVRKQVEIGKFNGSAELAVKLHSKDMKLIFGLSDVPSEKIEGKYRIRKISKEKHAAGEEGI